jgi:hypothetical protein
MLQHEFRADWTEGPKMKSKQQSGSGHRLTAITFGLLIALAPLPTSHNSFAIAQPAPQTAREPSACTPGENRAAEVIRPFNIGRIEERLIALEGGAALRSRRAQLTITTDRTGTITVIHVYPSQFSNEGDLFLAEEAKRMLIRNGCANGVPIRSSQTITIGLEPDPS